MLIDVSVTLMNLEGETLKKSDKPFRLKDACCDALLGMYPDEQQLAGTEKYERFELARKIMKNDQVDLSAEEIAKCKAMIGKAFGTNVVGPAFDALATTIAPVASI